MRRTRLRPAAVLSVPLLIAAGTAEARVDGPPSGPLVSIAIPKAGSATVATVVITPRSAGARPDVEVVSSPALPRTLVAAVRMAPRADGRFLVTVVLVNPTHGRASRAARRPAGSPQRSTFRLRTRNLRSVRWDIAAEAEEWPRAPLPPCRILDDGDPGSPVPVFFQSGGARATPGELFGLGEDLACDTPADPGLLGHVGLPFGRWSFQVTGPRTVRASGSFSVPVSAFFFTRLPPVARVSCPARFRCGPALSRPDEPIVLYQGRARAGTNLETELTFRPSARLTKLAPWQSFFLAGEQIGPIDVAVVGEG